MNTTHKVLAVVATVGVLLGAVASPAHANYQDFTVKSDIYALTPLAGGSVALTFRTTVQNNSDQTVTGIRVRHRFKDEYAAKRTDVTLKDVSEFVVYPNCDTRNYKREQFGVKAVISDCGSLSAKPGQNIYYETYTFSADYVKKFGKGKETPVVTTRFFAEADQPHEALPKTAFVIDLKNLTTTATAFSED